MLARRKRRSNDRCRVPRADAATPSWARPCVPAPTTRNKRIESGPGERDKIGPGEHTPYPPATNLPWRVRTQTEGLMHTRGPANTRYHTAITVPTQYTHRQCRVGSRAHRGTARRDVYVRGGGGATVPFGNEPMHVHRHLCTSPSLSPSRILPPLAAAPLTAYRSRASSSGISRTGPAHLHLSGISTVHRRRLGQRLCSAVARLETREHRIAPAPARVCLVLAAARWACLGHATAA